jgi:hypothetical protein
VFDAATFGTIAQEPQSPGAGYVAFLAIALFLAGVGALPPAPWHLNRTDLPARAPR